MALAFLQCCMHELLSPRPQLVVVPASRLAFWEGEWAFWAGTGANVVTYAGSVAARTAIHDHELWLSTSSLDSKGASGWGRKDMGTKVSRQQKFSFFAKRVD